jgi:hypothetical protein
MRSPPHPSLDPEGELGFDGRADIVFFRQRRGTQFALDDLRLAEDVFAEIGAARTGPPGRVAAAVITRTGLEHAREASLAGSWTRAAAAARSCPKR